jgi:Putative transposase
VPARPRWHARFTGLQGALGSRGNDAFDLLHRDEDDLTEVPLTMHKQLLMRLVGRGRSMNCVAGASVTFRYKDYRIEGPGRYKAMTLEVGEFLRRFLLHVLPKDCIASTTACWPAAPSPTPSPRRASYSPPAISAQPTRSEQSLTAPRHRKSRLIHACGCRMANIETFEADQAPPTVGQKSKTIPLGTAVRRETRDTGARNQAYIGAIDDAQDRHRAIGPCFFHRRHP